MRQGEVTNLNIGCSKIESNKYGSTYRITGETSKLIGQKKTISWITSLESFDSIEIAEKISKRIAKNLALHLESIPLFLSTGYLYKVWSSNSRMTGNFIKKSQIKSKSQEFYQLIDCTPFIIKEEDIDFLNVIDPFRSWETEKKYQINEVWRFTSHQFRRSLAYYIAQSSLVSLPSLKRQLKHITRDMTLYYCNYKDTKDENSDFSDMSKMFDNNRHKSGSSSYEQNIIKSNERLYGAGGKHIEKSIGTPTNTDIYTVSRKELEERFIKGEISYKETPLGACTTTSPCMSRASLEIAACISCEKAVIKKSKLERVITVKKAFLDEFEETDCVEYRSEKSELDLLMKFNQTIDK
jgi:hypothetical protein